jgi:glycosyltransferase involved in cell wall biosynthesis
VSRATLKILLVKNYALDAQHSMLRFGDLLEVELHRAGHSVRVIRPSALLGRLVGNRGFGKWLGYADKFVLFPLRLRQAASWADVVHICDQAYAPYTRFLGSTAHVVTCHDLIAARCALGEFLPRRTSWSGRIYQRMILRGLARAHNVVCDSEATKSDLLRLVGREPSRTSKTYIALNYAYRPAGEGDKAVRLTRLGIRVNEPFILHVGGNVWYKNQAGVVRIFARLVASPQGGKLGLVMVSGGLTSSLREVIAAYGVETKVRVLANLEPEDLQALYSSAVAMLFPSLHEGFGWPIIEAQACGCPVFTSNRPPMTEIGGDAAVYLDPENPAEAAGTILENLPHAARIREAGFVNARRFSAQSMVARYLEAYSDALSSTPIPSPAKAAGVRQSF